MDENLTVYKALTELNGQQENAALATVVRTSGSTYRKESAKLLITESGKMIGNISAGCLENDVGEIAPEVMQSGKCRLLKYDNSAEEDVIWGLGLGCNGIVEIFVAPVFHKDLADFTLYDVLKQAIEDESGFALATIIATEAHNLAVASRMIIFSDGSSTGSGFTSDLRTQVVSDARKLLSKESSRTIVYQRPLRTDVYIETVLPRPRLVIIGADPDAAPIVRLAKQLGFKVELIDHRDMLANHLRYPEADEVHVIRPEQLASSLNLDPTTFVLVKTHNYLKDKEALKYILKAGVRYIGQMGPKARMQDLLADMSKEGVSFSDSELRVLHAPVGLDIGAESPEQIAVSILSEMLAVKNGRCGEQLKEQTSAIHPRKD